MKINLYKYILMTMAILLGLHLYNIVVNESMFMFYLNEEYSTTALAYLRFLINFSHLLTFLICGGLVVIAIGLYFVEFYICERTKN